MREIPLFGFGIRAISDIVTRQRRVNCLYDLRKDQDRSAVVLLGTPGSSVWTTLPSSPIRGWHTIGSTLYVCAGNSIYSVTTAGVYTLVATGVLGTDYVAMADNSVELIIVTGGPGFVLTLATSTLTQITDQFFPVGATSVVFINGRFYVNKPGTRQFFASGLLNGLSWTYLSATGIFGTKQNSSDLLLRVGNLNGVLVLWGESSVEFWQDVGTSPLPFQRINGATQSWGLAALQTDIEVGNSSMFLGYAPDGGLAVIRFNGYAPDMVSDSDLNTLFASFSRVDDAVALTYSAYGHAIYQITFPTENRSFAYDTNTGVWHEAQTGVAETGRHFAKYGITLGGKNYVTDSTTGKIYLLDVDTYTDDNQPIKRQIVTKHIRADENEVFISEVFFDFETGVGLQSGQGSDPMVAIRVSRDGGRTFGNERWVPLGKAGEYDTRVVLRRLGSARDFVMQLTVTDPVKFVVTSAAAEVEQG